MRRNWKLLEGNGGGDRPNAVLLSVYAADGPGCGNRQLLAPEGNVFVPEHWRPLVLCENREIRWRGILFVLSEW